MKFRISNGINWATEFSAKTACELKQRSKSACIKFKKHQLISALRSKEVELHFYKNGAWLNSNNSNFPPLISLKTYDSKESFSTLFKKSFSVGYGYEKICSIADYVCKDELHLV